MSTKRKAQAEPPPSVDTVLTAALTPFGYPVWNAVKLNERKSEAEESKVYFAFNYTSTGIGYADDEPTGEVYFVQVHLFAPIDMNVTRLMQKTKQAIHGAGFTWPQTINASDDAGRHIVFESQYVEGVDLDGDLYMQ